MDMSPFIRVEDLIVCAIVNCTTDSEHFISCFLYPPCARAFHTCMSNKLMRRFDAAASDRVSTYSVSPVVNLSTVVFEVNN